MLHDIDKFDNYIFVPDNDKVNYFMIDVYRSRFIGTVFCSGYSHATFSPSDPENRSMSYLEIEAIASFMSLYETRRQVAREAN